MASISRFGRAISSAAASSDSNLPEQGLGIIRGLVQSFGEIGG